MPRAATRRYAARFASASAAGHFREPVGCGTPDEAPPLIASLGIGTYLGESTDADDEAYERSIVHAIASGVNEGERVALKEPDQEGAKQ